jgi:ribosomal protein S18 acetylase RimI-like enzyme
VQERGEFSLIEPPHRRATPGDAAALAELANMAGEGLPLYLWTGLAAAGEDPWEVGRQRALRETGSFSYRNSVVREESGRVVAALIGYALSAAAEAADYSAMPPMFVPLQQLEDLVPGTWYVNVLATLPTCRGRGFGSALLAEAERIATAADCTGLSIIVSDGNPGAVRLYRRLGYRERDSRPMVKEDWQNPGQNWILLTRDL